MNSRPRTTQDTPLREGASIALFKDRKVLLVSTDPASNLDEVLGVAPTANLNPERKFPSMFEPIHGSAFDIMGKGIANPLGCFWTGAMLLDHRQPSVFYPEADLPKSTPRESLPQGLGCR